MKRKSHWGDEEGVTLIEGAVILPLLTFLLFAIIQWALIMSAHVSVRNGAAVAARRFLVSPVPASSNWNSEARTIAASTLGPLYDGTRLTANVQQPVIVGVASAYQVTLTYSLPLFIPWTVPGANPDGTYNVIAVITVG